MKLFIYSFVFLLSVVTCFAQKPVAELPRVYIDTTWQEPSGGTRRAVHSADQLAKALADSTPGDVIVLDAGKTYAGTFLLPAKSNPSNKWIYVISSALTKLPTGSRITPADAVNMAKVVTLNTAPAFQVQPGAKHWRLAGLEITAQSNYPAGCGGAGQPNCMTYFLVGSQWPLPSEPDSIVVDRSYLHGSPTQDLQAGWGMNCSNCAIIDSEVSDIHIKGFDCNAVSAFHTPGPLKIVNNKLEAAGENIIFGGSGRNFNPWVPSDIEIRNNYLYKPLSWVPLSLPPGNSIVVKNAFELKSAQRVLFDNNVIENVWKSGQMGFAIVLTVRSAQSGDIAVVNDVTVTNNVLKNVVSGVNGGAADDQCGKEPYTDCHNAGSQDRWYIANNLILFYDPALAGGDRNLAFNIQPGIDRVNGRRSALRNVVFERNTIVAASSKPCWNSVFFGTGGQKPPLSNLTDNIWIVDNVLCKSPTGDWGLQGTAGLTQYMGDPAPLDKRFAGNVVYVPAGERVPALPSHNFVTDKPLAFGPQFQLLNSPAKSNAEKPAGFSPVGVNVPIPSAPTE